MLGFYQKIQSDSPYVRYFDFGFILIVHLLMFESLDIGEDILTKGRSVKTDLSLRIETSNLLFSEKWEKRSSFCHGDFFKESFTKSRGTLFIPPFQIYFDRYII